MGPLRWEGLFQDGCQVEKRLWRNADRARLRRVFRGVSSVVVCLSFRAIDGRWWWWCGGVLARLQWEVLRRCRGIVQRFDALFEEAQRQKLQLAPANC